MLQSRTMHAAMPVPSSAATALFAKATVLTAASPLTILFWTGIFASRLEERRSGADGRFAAGCVFSTVVFLTAVAAVGSLLHRFLPTAFLPIVNATVGLLLAGIGIGRTIQSLHQSPEAL